MFDPENNTGNLEESIEDNSNQTKNSEQISIKEKLLEDIRTKEDNAQHIEDHSNGDGKKIKTLVKGKKGIRERKQHKGEQSPLMPLDSEILSTNPVLMEESSHLYPDVVKPFAEDALEKQYMPASSCTEGNAVGNPPPSSPSSVEPLIMTSGVNKKAETEENKLKRNIPEGTIMTPESKNVDANDENTKGEEVKAESKGGSVITGQKQSPGAGNETKEGGTEEEGKKCLHKIPGITSGTVRTLGSGLKGSSLPLFLSMPGGGGGLSLLSAGLPPGRYVILPSTTSSIPSISSIASTSAGVTTVKPPVITSLHQMAKPIPSTTASSNVSNTSASSTATTSTTTSTSVIPSIVIPPAVSGRVVRPMGRGAYCGGRSVRGRRKSYTAAEKLAMIEAVESGQKKSNVADLFGVAPSTLACILLQKNKIRSDQMKVDLSRRRLRQTRQAPLMPAPRSRSPSSSVSGGRDTEGGSDPFVHFLSSLSPPRPTVFEDSPEEIISMPDLSDRMGMDAPPSQGKMEASSNYLTCSPLISAMPGIHEELMHGAGPSSSSHDHFEGESLPGDYEGEEMMEVKQEPVLSMSSEICEDENSQNNTQSSSDRRSTQSSPTPVGMAGPYLLKKETHCSTILDQLLRDDTFSDVTLTAEGQSIRAHKIVLCLASAYFRQVLSKESTVQNVIVFRDIKFSELRNLINFIYTGEATVDASDLESFMKTAEMLEVNSLSDGQRNIPKNFLPRAREMEPDRPPRGPSSSSSKRSSQNAGPGSPPSKSRRTSAEVSPPPRTYKQTFPTTVASGPPVPPLVQFPPPVIKTEPKSEESLEDDFPTQREEEQEVYDNHDRSPSQPHDPDQSPPLDRLGDPSASEIPPPGKCPFCSGPQPVWRERALTKHLYVCHPDKTVFPCDICSRAFLKESAYETHKDDCR